MTAWRFTGGERSFNDTNVTAMCDKGKENQKKKWCICDCFPDLIAERQKTDVEKKYYKSVQL